MRIQWLSLPSLTFPLVFYFFLIFAVSMMQLRKTAALLGDSLSHQQKKKTTADEGGDGGVAFFPILFFLSLFLPVSASYFVWIEHASVGSKAWCCINGTSHVDLCQAIPETLASLAQSQGCCFTESNVRGLCLLNPKSFRALSRIRVAVSCYRIRMVHYIPETNTDK